MDKLTSILVVADRSPADRSLLSKAIELARTLGATLELYTCDSEHAADLGRAYDTAGVEKEWLERVWEGREYLEALRESVPAPDVRVFVDCMCDVQTNRAITKKIAASHPDLVMKSASASQAGRFALNAADWELMRICTTDLMLTRGRQWKQQARFAAMVDMLDPETPSAAKAVMHAAEYLAVACGADLDVVYCEREASDPDRAPRAKELVSLAREHKVSPKQVHILSGEPDDVLPGFASRSDYDVVVLGTLTHRKRLANLVGKLTGRVADALDCDLLLVRSEDPAAVVRTCATGALWQGAFGD